MVSRLPLFTTDWQYTCKWLRTETEEPFTSQDPYYKMTPEVPKYSVLAWWDYGQWIIEEGRRVPVSSPGWFNSDVAKFLIAQPGEDAEEYIKNLNVRYIVLDREDFNSKFWAIVTAAGKDEKETPLLQINSMAARLWRGEVPGYTQIYETNHTSNVKILERGKK